jgi:hypothetical protein
LSYCSKVDLVGDNTGDLARTSPDLNEDHAGDLPGDLIAKKLCYVGKSNFTGYLVATLYAIIAKK